MASVALPLTRVHPDFSVIGGSTLNHVVGALLTYGLLTAVSMMVICAAGWALASARGSWHAAEKAKSGLFSALVGAVLIGGCLPWANSLFGIGAQL